MGINDGVMSDCAVRDPDSGHESVRDTDLVQVRIPGHAAYIGIARQAVDAVGEQMGLSAEDRSAVKLAVGEACNNAVQYGRPGDPDTKGADLCAAAKSRMVFVACRLRSDALEIDVLNRGNGFHPVPGVYSMPKPEALAEHGRGLPLMEIIMDSVEYSNVDGSTLVRMRKQVTPPLAEPCLGENAVTC
ncbi:MAG: ATP-binding protein [Cytophagales bacterium]|nr:ATP-binding protein [Armatimonadota bacterium]